ncbi:MAG: methylated-DNA--[protein]-cysteine S-methyltransferase [Nitrospira sp.]|nr:methylated-DNA--[protein]-cysteine S-methyltransferase [bacterium]MBL7048803.1 methylated-DNA--[protein]-cysteine S-methyltransferase [Nitrospira sp.]
MPLDISLQKGAAPWNFIGELDSYFKGTGKLFSVETVFLSGTEFQKNVWNALQLIPYGETRSYKWLAAEIGRPGAVRAVGGALSKNPLPIVLPCHRVIKSDSSLGGFACGIGIKKSLLDMESSI